jgi:hypothetical protein
MSDALPFKLDDGSLVYIEVKDAEVGMQRAGRGDAADAACGRFSEAIAHLRPAAEAVLDAFREMNTPDEIALEFGVKFSAKLGVAILASTQGEATFKVSLKWSNTRSADEKVAPAL